MKIKQLVTQISACAVLIGAMSMSVSVSAHDHKSHANAEHSIGLQMYSLRNEMAEDLEKAVSHVQKWGITEVEGGGALYGKTMAEFKSLLNTYDIEIVSADTSFDEIRDEPMKAVERAKLFGAKYTTIYWIPHDGAKGFTIENAKAAVKILNEGGALLAKHGITLQYHPHGYEFLPYKDGTILDYMLQNTTEAEFQMDVFWIKQGGGDPVEILQKYPGRFKTLHLKDRLHGTPISSDGMADREKVNVVLGTGDVGIAAVIKEAKKQGIKYFFIEDESSRVLKQVPLSIEYIKPLIFDK